MVPGSFAGRAWELPPRETLRRAEGYPVLWRGPCDCEQRRHNVVTFAIRHCRQRKPSRIRAAISIASGIGLGSGCVMANIIAMVGHPLNL